jgi:hypothetical protein
MTMLVVVLDGHGSGSALDAATVSRLAELGVTRLAVARDDAGEAIVLEGWAFDAETYAAEATRLVAGGAAARPLQPVLQALLCPTDDAGPADGGRGERPRDQPAHGLRL